MSRERWREVDALVDRALSLPGPERARFIADQCAGDRDLLSEVLDLLLATEEADAIVTPAVTPSTTPGTAEAPEPTEPAGFGAFELVRELGRGGMGTVYLAQQHEPVRRRVAVKLANVVLPSREARLRLEAERQALARLSHPNVAQLFEAGTTGDGRPYFAMEYVDGEPITAYCDRFRLPRKDRLELFLKVCAGVEHAHQKGVLHRDLKPSNMLVTDAQGRAVPKVIDFGIAKALDQPLVDATLLTGERMLGTPAYLSPEAISGRPVDTRADVYGLGVLLQELLIGERPFSPDEGVPLMQRLRQVAEDDPEPPSRRWQALSDPTRQAAARRRQADPRGYGRELRGDLDWIVGRALARDPEQRYASVGALAADLRRHLADEPVLAGPPTTGYRLRKLVRRRKGPILAGALLLLALVGGLVARTIEAGKAREQAEVAHRAQRQAEEVRDFLVELLQEANPLNNQGVEPTVGAALEAGIARLEEGDLATAPLVRADLLETLASAQWRRGDYSSARELAEESLALRRRHMPPQALPISDGERMLGLIERDLGLYESAERRLRRALELCEKRAGPRSREVATALLNLAVILEETERDAEARELLRRATEIREEIFGPDSLPVAHALNNLANLEANEERFDEAIRVLERAREIYRREAEPTHPRLALILYNLGRYHLEAGRTDRAAELLGQALDLRRRGLGDDHRDVGLSLVAYAGPLRLQGRWDDAIRTLNEAEEILVAALGRENASTAYPLYNRGTTRADAGRLRAGREDLERALAHWSQTLGRRSELTLSSRMHLARIERLEGNPGEARRLLEEEPGIEESRAVLAAGSSGVRETFDAEVGWALLGAGDLVAAEALFRDTRRRVDEKGFSNPDLDAVAGRCALGLAEIARRRGPAGEAREHVEAALEAFATLPPDHVERLGAEKQRRKIP